MAKKVGTTINPKPVIPDRPIATIVTPNDMSLSDVLLEFKVAIDDALRREKVHAAHRENKKFSYLELDVTLHARSNTYRIWAR